MKHLQFWRIWTAGWGPRDWWRYLRREGFAVWIAFMLPRRMALWAFIRVYAHGCKGSPGEEYERIYRAWEQQDWTP